MQANYEIAPNKGALRKSEAAAFVGLPVSSWDRMVKKGDAPPATYVSPRRPVWLKEILLTWLRDLGASRKQPVDTKRKTRKQGTR